MRRLNLGCGNDYRSDWVNVDLNRSVRTDVCADLDENLPFADDSFSEVLLDNVLEHVHREKFFAFMAELHRVCRPGACITIFVPHYSGMYALKHPTHYNCFGIGTFHVFEPDAPPTGERYSNARFKVLQERLLFFHHNLVHFSFLSRAPINWLFNFGLHWKQLMERIQFLGFDEIHYELEVRK